jgi:hypothetical protein
MTTDSSLARPFSVASTLSDSLPSQIPSATGKRPAWMMLVVVGVALAIGYVVFAPRYSWLPNTGLPDLRNKGLRDKLHTCESFGVVNADVYYDGAFSSDVVVFDLLDGGSSEVRRIDPVHLLLQFATQLDLNAIDRVILSRAGKMRFEVSGSNLRPLADSYAGGGRVWAFNNLPQAIRTSEGKQAYGEWTGGWLGVLQKQTEDLNNFIEAWTEH